VARGGFTLIELLVVITVIALLIGILVPVSMEIRDKARETVCAQNLRTLMIAWLIYKDENDDRLAGGHVGKYVHDWVQIPTGDGDSVEREKEGIRSGVLFSYVGESADVYRCPSDVRKTATGEAVFRSYSIAGGANGEGWQNSYLQVRKYSEICSPGNKYVFLEQADPRGWNMSSWVVNPQTGSWVDPLAAWHRGNRCTLSFADGHTEVHKWIDESTVEMCESQEFFYLVPADQGRDLRYMIDGFPSKATGTP